MEGKRDCDNRRVREREREREIMLDLMHFASAVFIKSLILGFMGICDSYICLLYFFEFERSCIHGIKSVQVDGYSVQIAPQDV